jgi:hypothetical protein
MYRGYLGEVRIFSASAGIRSAYHFGFEIFIPRDYCGGIRLLGRNGAVRLSMSFM